jgi:hypothetical protein
MYPFDFMLMMQGTVNLSIQEQQGGEAHHGAFHGHLVIAPYNVPEDYEVFRSILNIFATD